MPIIQSYVIISQSIRAESSIHTIEVEIGIGRYRLEGLQRMGKVDGGVDN
jgi:hypothetical protein